MGGWGCRRALWRRLPGPGGGGRCCCRRGRCRRIGPSAQPSRGFGAPARTGAKQAAARATGRSRQRTPSPYLGLGCRLRTRQSPLRTWGGGDGRDPGEERCLLEFPLLTFNLGMRWLGMRRARRSATAATGVLRAEDKQKLRGSSPRHPRLRHPLPGSDTLNPRQLLSFPPAATKEVGRTEGGVRSQDGRQAGGEEREIRLLGLLIWMAV